MTRTMLHYVKLGLCRAIDFGFTGMYRAHPKPWEPRHNEKRTPKTAGELASLLEFYTVLGWFDPERYSPGSANGVALVRLIREARARGSKVCLILLPETSVFRRREPPEAAHCLAEINKLFFRDDPVPVYDLRDQIPDPMFVDLVHPNLAAEEPITVMVGDCVREFLSGSSSSDRAPLGATRTSIRGVGKAR
jgi:hypothetical protein